MFTTLKRLLSGETVTVPLPGFIAYLIWWCKLCLTILYARGLVKRVDLTRLKVFHLGQLAEFEDWFQRHFSTEDRMALSTCFYRMLTCGAFSVAQRENAVYHCFYLAQTSAEMEPEIVEWFISLAQHRSPEIRRGAVSVLYGYFYKDKSWDRSTLTHHLFCASHEEKMQRIWLLAATLPALLPRVTKYRVFWNELLCSPEPEIRHRTLCALAKYPGDARILGSFLSRELKAELTPQEKRSKNAFEQHCRMLEAYCNTLCNIAPELVSVLGEMLSPERALHVRTTACQSIRSLGKQATSLTPIVASVLKAGELPAALNDQIRQTLAEIITDQEEAVALLIAHAQSEHTGEALHAIAALEKVGVEFRELVCRGLTLVMFAERPRSVLDAAKKLLQQLEHTEGSDVPPTHGEHPNNTDELLGFQTTDRNLLAA